MTSNKMGEVEINLSPTSQCLLHVQFIICRNRNIPLFTMQMTTKEETVVIGFKSELNEAEIKKQSEN